MARTLEAMRVGRLKYEERLRAAGITPPWVANGFKPGWRKRKRQTEEVKAKAEAEVARIEALPPIEKKRNAALDAIAAMRENLRRSMECQQ